MSDDWEEDEFEVPDFTSKLNQNNTISNVKKFEDEEEETKVKTAEMNTKNKQNEAALKKAREEEIKLANKLKFAQLDSLSPEERRIRERQMIEEADVRIAGELFGTDASGGLSEEEMITRGLGSIPMKTKQDHVNFAILCANKMEDSTSFNISAFYKEITDNFKQKLTLEGLDEIVKMLTVIRDEKKKAAALNAKTEKKTVKQMKAESKKHADVFGGADDYYDNNANDYSAYEDSFM